MTVRTRRIIFVTGISMLCFVVTAVILARLSGQLVKTHIEKALGGNVKADTVSVSWGKVTIDKLTFLRDGEVVGDVKSVEVKAAFLSILQDTSKISRVEVDQPYFRFVVDKKGNLLLPMPTPEKQADEVRNKRGKGEGQKDTKTKDALPFEVKTLTVRGGRVDFEDRSTARPVALTFEGVTLDAENILYPAADQWTRYDLSSRFAGRHRKGSISATGKMNLLKEETRVKTDIKDIDLVLLRPYLEKKGDLGIEGGFISMHMDASIVKKHIKAPGTMAIRDLQLSSSGGIGGTFLGVPSSMVLSFLKNNNNEISLDFVLEGDLKNPRFNLRENLATRLSVGLANKLGVSIMGTGEAVAGGSSRIINETIKNLKGLFK